MASLEINSYLVYSIPNHVKQDYLSVWRWTWPLKARLGTYFDGLFDIFYADDAVIWFFIRDFN